MTSPIETVTDPSALAPGVAPEESGLELLLYGLQSPINIGMILRVAESYQFRVSVYDRHRIFEDQARLRTIEDFACGAVARRGFRLVDEHDLKQRSDGRRFVATTIDAGTAALPSFRFRPGDVVALGNEYDGLPDEVIARADVVLNIPMPSVWTPKPKSLNPIDPTRTTTVARDGQPNLNVAMSAGIICYAAYADRMTANCIQ
jgi:tRNA G18 (ribose-2'-O)-methylase SpoU